MIYMIICMYAYILCMHIYFLIYIYIFINLHKFDILQAVDHPQLLEVVLPLVQVVVPVPLQLLE